MGRDKRKLILIKKKHALFKLFQGDREWEEHSYRFDIRNEIQNLNREERKDD